MSFFSICGSQESCIGTGQTCDSGTWHKQRRTHRLSNGEVIWDLAGNVMETIKDTIDDNYGTPSYVSQVTTSTHTASYSLTGGTTETSRNAKNQIGPSGNYSMLDSGSYGGLGYANFFVLLGRIERGGFFDIVEVGNSGAPSAGVFSFLTNRPVGGGNLQRAYNVGFRCTYHLSSE